MTQPVRPTKNDHIIAIQIVLDYINQHANVDTMDYVETISEDIITVFFAKSNLTWGDWLGIFVQRNEPSRLYHVSYDGGQHSTLLRVFRASDQMIVPNGDDNTQEVLAA